ncbi:MAG: retropepsin-like domain-containing protein [Pirellulales bacterium]|nr:retropepsin-like domain-containing protein [Pirellulales bacterium]
MKCFHFLRVGVVVCALVAALGVGRAFATGVPIGGFLPMVGIGLTDEFLDDFNTAAIPSTTLTGTLLGAGGQPFYDVALLDTGAAVSLLTNQAFDDFGLGDPSPGETDGYRGTEVIQIGGATGTLEAEINDPLGLYVGGLQGRASANPLVMNHAALQGQTNTSTITLPAESELPNVVGLSYASQYATYIRSDQPQIFTLDGKTVRTPSIEFLPLGSGGQGITRRAPLSLNPSSSFQQPPAYLFHIPIDDIDNPQENPSLPTVIQGGLFLNVNLANNGANLNNSSFFFDTGADVSVLSEFSALQLGIDVTLDEPDFTVAVIGSGGAKADVPGYYLDQFTIQAIGGSVVANNVPVIVLDVADPSNPANIVPGIVGTNLLAGRNVVIDPKPSLGGGGASPSLYISDPVTTQHNWTSTDQLGNWPAGSSWSAGVPGTLGIANVRHTLPQNAQSVTLDASTTVWELNVSGASTSSRIMKFSVLSGVTLTTFAGINIEPFAIVTLQGGSLDAQYVEILGGTLTGNGNIFTGSGPIAGQVENRSGTVAPGIVGVGTLDISGRFANGSDGTLSIGIGGTMAGAQHGQLVIDGPATLDGILKVHLSNLGGGTFVPNLGNAFSILTATEVGGEFSTLNLPTLAADKMWQVTYDVTAVLLKVTIPGDFDGDFTVDGDDLTVWREDFGGIYSGADFLTWQRNLGMSIAPIAAVPEPSALALGAIALGGIALRRRSSGSLSRG